MASPGSRPSPAPSTPGSQAPAASPAAAINPATKKKEITAVQAAKAKAMNVFTSDGSFLERFKKMKEEEVEKKKQEDALARQCVCKLTRSRAEQIDPTTLQINSSLLEKAAAQNPILSFTFSLKAYVC
ncbi:hypothetical protein PGTUg99_010443 [Puccinia graminis f. sp. tritici]|uniref:Uncharacterized protein n=1 Tax=Puccinia graminis f. sp. tritici TaxID=56615 RepID=A0A5B0NWT8_PUCGR|nr:hypothetical protein PGTUg99_010443 [Puccinia graminis f. sp. tritici]